MNFEEFKKITKNYEVIYLKHDNYIEIKDEEHCLSSLIDIDSKKIIGYYVTGVYNNCIDYVKINMFELYNLQQVCSKVVEFDLVEIKYSLLF